MFNQFHAPFSSAQCGVAHRPGETVGGRHCRPIFFELLTAGGLAESAMPAFQGPAESGAGTIGCGRSTWSLVLANSTNALLSHASRMRLV